MMLTIFLIPYYYHMLKKTCSWFWKNHPYRLTANFQHSLNKLLRIISMYHVSGYWYRGHNFTNVMFINATCPLNTNKGVFRGPCSRLGCEQTFYDVCILGHCCCHGATLPCPSFWLTLRFFDTIPEEMVVHNQWKELKIATIYAKKAGISNISKKAFQ